MAKHRSIWGYWARCAPWMRHEFPTWRQAFFYRARHRGVYKPPAQPVKPILLGETYITIYPDMRGFGINARQAMNDMVSFRLGTDPEAPWAIPRD